MVYIIHECHCGSCPGSSTPKHPSGEMVFGGSLCRCKCHPENRISPHILYKQANGDSEEYKRLLIENRHLIRDVKENEIEELAKMLMKIQCSTSDLNTSWLTCTEGVRELFLSRATTIINEGYSRHPANGIVRSDIDDEKYNDNWPEGSLEEFIWVRCESNNRRVRDIMKSIEKRFGQSNP